MRYYIKKYAIGFGLLAGLFSFLFYLGLYLTIPNPLNNRRPDIGINIIIVFFSIWYYKRLKGGRLHFYEGFSIGIITHVVATLFSAVLLFLFNNYYDGQPMQTYIEESIKFIQNDNIGSEAKLSASEKSTLVASIRNLSAWQLFFDEISFKFLFGIIPITLISMILRKQ